MVSKLSTFIPYPSFFAKSLYCKNPIYLCTSAPVFNFIRALQMISQIAQTKLQSVSIYIFPKIFSYKMHCCTTFTCEENDFFLDLYFQLTPLFRYPSTAMQRNRYFTFRRNGNISSSLSIKLIN